MQTDSYASHWTADLISLLVRHGTTEMHIRAQPDYDLAVDPIASSQHLYTPLNLLRLVTHSLAVPIESVEGLCVYQQIHQRDAQICTYIGHD